MGVFFTHFITCIWLSSIYISSVFSWTWTETQKNLLDFDIDDESSCIPVIQHTGTNNSNTKLGTTGKKYQITVCATVRNSLPYVVEWMLFHKLQGVEHFIIYDDASSDDIALLPKLFKSWDPKIAVEVFPDTFLRHNAENERNYANISSRKFFMLNHCHARYEDETEWMLFLDPDEFIYSKQNQTVHRFLMNQEQMKESVSEFRIPAAQYGSSGLVRDFKAWILPDMLDGSLSYVYEPVGSPPRKHPFQIRESRSRAPHPTLNKDFVSLFNDTCNGINQDLCIRTKGKSIFKPDHCLIPNIPSCQNLTGISEVVRLDDIRLDHYAWRSTEQFGLPDNKLDTPQVDVFKRLDRIWFSTILDDSKDRFVPIMERFMSNFLVWPYRKVGRTCQEFPSQTGQQVACPKTFPYARDNGKETLVLCCYSKTDCHGEPLSEKSSCCISKSSLSSEIQRSPNGYPFNLQTFCTKLY